MLLFGCQKSGITAVEYAVLIGSKNEFEQCGGCFERRGAISKEFKHLLSHASLPTDGTFAERLLAFPAVAELLPEAFGEWRRIVRELIEQ
jgi:hypothetical protein